MPKPTSPEQLFDCPDCGQPNFTAKGLSGHRGKKACLERIAANAAALVKANPELAAGIGRFQIFHGITKQSATVVKLAKYYCGLEIHNLRELHHTLYGETRGGDHATAEVTLADFLETQLGVTYRTTNRYHNWFLSVATPQENAALVKKLNKWWEGEKPKLLGNGEPGKALALGASVTQADLEALASMADEWGLNELFEKPARDVTPAAEDDDDDGATANDKDAVIKFWKDHFLRRLGRKDYLRLPKTVREQLATSLENVVIEIKDTLKAAKKKARRTKKPTA
jgi:hypothetical protein